jgi:tRNA pseudouridine38-40 synthase
MTPFSAILLAGGKGERFGTKTPKQFLLLEGIPVALHSFSLICSHPDCQEAVVVCEAKFRSLFTCKPLLRFAEPGLRRQDSVWNALQALLFPNSLLLIHDLARPLLTQKALDLVLEKGRQTGNCCLAKPVTNTIKEARKGVVKKTLNRSSLYEVETPQVVAFDALYQGFAIALEKGLSLTDDCSIAELSAKPSHLTMKYKIIIAYEGTAYNGWQIQPNGVTIQQTIENALHQITREQVKVIGSGRTDAGVHAEHQVAHFTLQREFPAEMIKKALNGTLPSDIRIVSSSFAPASFHAQKSAIGKSYHYHITLGEVSSPFFNRTSWHIQQNLDIDAMRKASSYFVGEHDFSSFANEQFKGAAGKNPIRHLYRLDICDWTWGIRLEFEGNGFLYKMVRNIVGALVAVGKGKMPPQEILSLLAKKDRTQSPQAAPAKGLFLHFVHYPEEKISSKE